MPEAVMKVLIAYDGSTCADAAVEELKYAGFPGHTEALVVTVAHEGFPRKDSVVPRAPEDSAWQAGIKEAAALSNDARLRIQRDFPDWKVSSEPLWGDTQKTLLKTIEHWKPDVVVVGSHGRNAAGRLVLGSVSLELVRHAPCTVRVSRAHTDYASTSPRILVATDGSAHAEAAIQEIAARKWSSEIDVKVICVLQTLVPAVAGMGSLESSTFATEPAFQIIEHSDKEERERLQTVARTSVATLMKNAGITASASLIEGNPADAIVKEAETWNAGTVFVGARGLGLLDRIFLGSVSNAAVNHCHCTVEVVRPQAISKS